MPLGIHNPLPSSMGRECGKAAKILTSFVDPRQAFGPDKVIPPEILAGAKGLAILTVLKAGFIGSGRLGSGIVVARLADGSWSAPSAIGTAGAGVGGQIGVELTDFVFILNDAAAVRTFSQSGALTLGGNVSLAAGPVGRNAEAAGAASSKGVAAIFSYSKTKGLFAGVSLEGSVLVERKDANEKLYGCQVSAAQLLTGSVPPPPQSAALMRVLNCRAFQRGRMTYHDSMYNDMPVYGDHHDDVVWGGRQTPHSRPGRSNTNSDQYVSPDSPHANIWTDDDYDRSHLEPPNGSNTFDDSDRPPTRPTAPKPVFRKPSLDLRLDQAIALYTFDADQDGDLGFKKGEIITIIKRTDKKEDWWTGRIGDRVGIFPSNYVGAP